jgi:long-chain fatty acid transport protein
MAMYKLYNSESGDLNSALVRKSLVRALLLHGLPALFFCSSAATGAGFALTDYSVKGMGSAYAGTTAGPDEAATIYWNPAGMTRLKGVHLQGGAAYIDFRTKFRDEGSTQTLLANPGPPPSVVTLPSSGGDDNANGSFVVPNGYVTVPVGDRVTLGLGVHIPFGLETKYGATWVGRYHAIESSLSSVDINPSIAYRIDDRWSVGAGISAQYVDTTLSRAVFTGGSDGFVKLEGDDWAAGFNVGILFEANEQTRFGLSFRSAIDHDIKGTRSISGVGFPFDGDVGGKVGLKLPPNVAFGLRRQVDDSLTLMADVTWTRWSTFEELRVSFDDLSPDEVTVHGWNDVWRLSLGLEYGLSPDWTLRGGFMYDQSPVPGAEERTPRIPDSDRTWIAVGATWRPTSKMAVDFAYVHLFLDDANVRNTIDLAPAAAPGAFTDTLVGKYDSASDALALELRYLF